MKNTKVNQKRKGWMDPAETPNTFEIIDSSPIPKSENYMLGSWGEMTLSGVPNFASVYVPLRGIAFGSDVI